LIIFFSSYKILYNYILRCLLKKHNENQFLLRVRKKLKNWLNHENGKKNNKIIRTMKKTIKLIKILKKLNWTQTGKKRAKPKKKRAKLVWTGFCSKKTEPKPVCLNQFRFFLIRFGYFFYKNQTELKMITPNFYTWKLIFFSLNKVWDK